MASYARSLVAGGALALAVSTTAVAQPMVAPPSPSADAVAVRNFLDGHGSAPSGLEDKRTPAMWQVVRTFYETRGFLPAWIQDGVLTPRGRHLVVALANAPREGLDSRRYAIPTIGGTGLLQARADGQAGLPTRDVGQLEVVMSFALLRLAADLAQGQVDPRGTLILWVHQPRAVDYAAVLQRAAASERPDAEMASLRPSHAQYALLARALEQHRAVAAAGGWGTVPGGWKLKPGGAHANVLALRKRLFASGNLAAPVAAGRGNLLDPALVAAVRRFESRHGMVPDGIVDPELLGALNVPAEERARQIELNLERWRWQPLPRSREILVNVPTFSLHGYAGGQERINMKVVTGKGDTPTPVFGREMTTVVFSPYWNVPPNILLDEVLPAALRGSGYLSRQNMEVVRNGQVVPASIANLRANDAAIRQRPGSGNSLGLVKFVFPNSFNVYLHDTNAKSLFARSRRAASHGCVRVEKPMDLARFVLEGEPQWTGASIAAAMRAGRERHVPLAAPLPVTIGYFTTWVDADGTVRFAPDVYRHDISQRRLLPESMPLPARQVAGVPARPVS